MKTYILLFSAFLFSYSSMAQSNALDFDGGNDLASASNAQSLIAGSTFSMTMWVRPTKSGGPFGFAGFRNNSNADFYLLQLSATSLEARFRNSSGTNYDIRSSTLVQNSWQHFVMTYDGSRVRLYRNGVLTDSVTASGSLSSSAGTFYLGGLPWSSSYFRLDGRLDDVSLWNTALSASEISCIYQYGIDTSKTGLQVYYSFDQGNAGKKNTGKTTVTDMMGNANATMTGFSMNGSTSNWVSGVGVHTYVNGDVCEGDSFLFGGSYRHQEGRYFDYHQIGNCDSIVQLILTVHEPDSVKSANRICMGDSVEFNGIYLKEEGVYTFNGANRFGCDSTSTKTIDVDTVDVGIGQGGQVLFSTAQNALYQWYNCDGDSIIPGETGQTFAFTPHARYAVIVTQNNCTDTSECWFTATNIEEFNSQSWNLYPNPSQDFILVDGITDQVTIEIYDAYAKKHLSSTLTNSAQRIDLSLLPSGLYFVVLSDGEHSESIRLLKE